LLHRYLHSSAITDLQFSPTDHNCRKGLSLSNEINNL